jgi:sugar lactone lactonase YvrE
VFDRKGKRTSVWGRKGEQAGEFHAPFRLAIDGTGRLFVTDVMNARVQWFSPFGQYLGTLKQFGAAEGKIFRPTGIDIDSKGRIWIGDSYTGLVQLFEENGALVRSLNLEGRPHVFGDPVGVAEGPQAVWVADQRENKVGWFSK